VPFFTSKQCTISKVNTSALLTFPPSLVPWRDSNPGQLGSFFNHNSSPDFELLFYCKSQVNHVNLIQVIGINFGRFFTNSSGHPAYDGFINVARGEE
jgi:hypothetical protein